MCSTLSPTNQSLDGHLFSQQQHQESTAGRQKQQSSSATPRALIYGSCLASCVLLVAHLLALAYNRAHARKLLGAIPARAPPALLVANSAQLARKLDDASSYVSAIKQQQQQQQQSDQTGANYHELVSAATTTTTTASSSSPTYGNAHEAAFAAVAAASEPLAAASSGDVPARKSAGGGNVRVQVSLLAHLLALELLLVLLVESQNALLDEASPDDAAGEWDFMGAGAWLCVLALYYLIAHVYMWLLGELLRACRSYAAAPNCLVASDDSDDWLKRAHAFPAAHSQQQIYGSSACHHYGGDSAGSPSTAAAPTECCRYNNSLSALANSAAADAGAWRALKLLGPAALSLGTWLCYSPLTRQLNELAYVRSLAAQISYWPLLVAQITWPSACVLAYCAPLVSFVISKNCFPQTNKQTNTLLTLLS